MQAQKLTGRSPRTATVDRGYKGKQTVGSTQINIPKPPLKNDTVYQKRKKRKYFRRRAAIEPIIGHLKTDHRVGTNFLKGQIGDQLNFMMAAAGFNYKKLMKKLKQIPFGLFTQIQYLIRSSNLHIIKNKTYLNMTAYFRVKGTDHRSEISNMTSHVYF